MKIIRITKENVDQYQDDLVELLKTLRFGEDPKLGHEERVAWTLSTDETRLYVAIEDEKAVSMGSICYIPHMAKYTAEIHDIATHPDYQGRGLAKGVMNHMIADAQTRANETSCPVQLSLTSRPARDTANDFYVKMGFTLIAEATEGGTNYYRYFIEPK